ncbi:MAG: hypothetical protein R6U52_06630 [Kosmotogaceae bacterium]
MVFNQIDNNFYGIPKGGIIVGVILSGKVVILTFAQAITDYLPSGGQPSSINSTYLNPKSKDLKNELVNQLLAAKLNVGFDLFDQDFAPATGNLMDLVLAFGTSPLDGFTVAEIISIADQVLSGIELNYSPSDIAEALSKINENFVDGADLGDLIY